MDSGAIAYIRQHKALGLGHAVWCARRLLSDEPFAVILPDDVIAAETPCLQQMVEAHAETGGNMVAAMEVPADKTSAYGILDIKDDMGSVVSVKGMVEKPAQGSAPSNLAVIGRYILTPAIMDNLTRIKSGAGGRGATDRRHRAGDLAVGQRVWLPFPGPAVRLRIEGRFFCRPPWPSAWRARI